MTRRRTQPGPALSTRGFTLIELLVSVSITAILLAGTTSVILVMGHALPSREDDLVRSMPAAQAANRIAAELQEATSIVFASPTAVEFTVADRDSPADNVDETIRYAWSGVPGDPLTRRYNGGTAYTVLEDVREFDLDYDSRSVIDGEPPLIEGPESVLLLQDVSNTGDGSNYFISSDSNMAQTFLPLLPITTVHWRITRVELPIQYDVKGGGNTSGTLAVRVRETAILGQPDDIVDELLVPEISLPKRMTPHEFQFTAASELDPNRPYAVSVEAASPDRVAVIKHGLNSLTSPDTRFWEHSGFENWQELINRDLRITVWGTASYPDPDWLPTFTVELRSVSIALNTGTTEISRILAGTSTLNRPSLP